MSKRFSNELLMIAVRSTQGSPPRHADACYTPNRAWKLPIASACSLPCPLHAVFG